MSQQNGHPGEGAPDYGGTYRPNIGTAFGVIFGGGPGRRSSQENRSDGSYEGDLEILDDHYLRHLEKSQGAQITDRGQGSQGVSDSYRDPIDEHFAPAQELLTDTPPAVRRGSAGHPTKGASAPPVQARASKPAPISLGEKFRSLSTKGKAVVAAGVSAVILAPAAAGIAAETGTWPFANNACADETHALGGNGTVAEAAERISDERRYHISIERLAAANDLSTEDRPGGRFCFVIPAPLAQGQEEADGSYSIDQLALWYGIDPATVRQLNPDTLPARNDEIIPAGTVIWFTDKAPENVTDVLVIRELLEPQFRLAGESPEQVEQMLNANLPRVLRGAGLVTGELLYLPYDSTETSDSMRKANITPESILQAYNEQGAFDPARRGQQPGTSTATEAAPPIAISITPEQETHIDSLERLHDDQKKFMKEFLTVMGRVEPQIQQSAAKLGIDPNLIKVVMMGQAMKETGWGQTSKLVPYHNYFGMATSANDARWAGRPTVEMDDRLWRVYGNFEEGLVGYLENLDSKPWYNDRANAHSVEQYIQALLAHLGANGLVDGNEPSYVGNEEPTYGPELLELIEGFGIAKLFGSKVRLEAPDLPAATPPAPTAPATPSQPGAVVRLGPVFIDLNNYDPKERDLVSLNDGATARGIPLGQLTPEGKWQIIMNELSGVELSVAGFNEFQARFKDVSAQVMADPRLTNFQDLNGWGKTAEQTEYIILHYTATVDQANGRPCYSTSEPSGASTMQNGGGADRVASIHYMNNVGEVCQLTHYLVHHIIGAGGITNQTAEGIEITAGGQEAITTQMYQDAIYWTVMRLIAKGQVRPGQSVTDVVNRVVLGHAEQSISLGSDRHFDMPAPVMDQLRIGMVETLVLLGYAR